MNLSDLFRSMGRLAKKVGLVFTIRLNKINVMVFLSFLIYLVGQEAGYKVDLL